MPETWVRSWVRKIPWRRAWQPTTVFLPGESHGQRSLVGYSLWGRKGSDRGKWLTHTWIYVYWLFLSLSFLSFWILSDLFLDLSDRLSFTFSQIFSLSVPDSGFLKPFFPSLILSFLSNLLTQQWCFKISVLVFLFLEVLFPSWFPIPFSVSTSSSSCTFSLYHPLQLGLPAPLFPVLFSGMAPLLLEVVTGFLWLSSACSVSSGGRPVCPGFCE